MTTTLVVDDEPMVRQLVRRILEPDLCEVIEVDGGESALRLIQQQPDAIDVVLTDLVMPGVDGFDVVEVLTRHLPDLPVVCMTGYGGQLAPIRQVTAPVLPKPFTTEALRELIAPLVEQSRARRGKAGTARSRARTGPAAGEARRTRSQPDEVDLVAIARALRMQRDPPLAG
jgi:two-component system cell cycle sensor histidine kinase/response regulator CckA